MRGLHLRSGYILIAPIWPFFELGRKYLNRWDEMCYGSTYFTLVSLQELHDYHITTMTTFPRVQLHAVHHGPNDEDYEQ